LNNFRLTCEIERTLGRGANTPYARYNKEEVEEQKLKIRRVLGALNLNPWSPPLDKRPGVVEDDLFSSLCSKYITILNNPTSGRNLIAAPHSQNSSNEEMAQAILSLLRDGQSDNALHPTH